MKTRQIKTNEKWQLKMKMDLSENETKKVEENHEIRGGEMMKKWEH